MEKNIKDIIHFYLGCECVNSSFPKGHLEYDKGWKFRGIDPTTPKSFLIETETEYTFSESIMPKLRKLESMTEEEMIEMIKHFSKIDLSHCIFEFSEDEGDNHAWVNAIENGQVVDCLDVNLFDHTVMMMDDYREVTITLPQSETFAYLLSKGFDLFGLLESGLATEKQPTTQK